MRIIYINILLTSLLIGCSITGEITADVPEGHIVIESDYYLTNRYNIWYLTNDSLVQSPDHTIEWISLDTNGLAKQSFRLPPTSTGGDQKIIPFDYFIKSDTLFFIRKNNIGRKYLVSTNRDTITEINKDVKSTFVGIKK